jgi:hypothetical protein
MNRAVKERPAPKRPAALHAKTKRDLALALAEIARLRAELLKLTPLADLGQEAIDYTTEHPRDCLFCAVTFLLGGGERHEDECPVWRLMCELDGIDLPTPKEG